MISEELRPLFSNLTEKNPLIYIKVEEIKYNLNCHQKGRGYTKNTNNRVFQKLLF